MANSALITCKTDPVLKDQARRVFSEIGIDMTTAVNMFLRQVVRQNGIPFTLSAGPVAPSLEGMTILTPARNSAGVPILPADWNDADDDAYDGLLANA